MKKYRSVLEDAYAPGKEVVPPTKDQVRFARDILVEYERREKKLMDTRGIWDNKILMERFIAKYSPKMGKKRS